MNEIKKVLVKFKETNKKMKHIKVLQEQVNKYFYLIEEIKRLYANETDTEIKKKLLFSKYQLVISAQIINNKVSKLLNELDIYVHSDL